MFLDLDPLRAEEDPRQRGRELEKVLQRLFERSRFDVVRDAGAARPRQTDLIADDGRNRYLIEAKWTRRPVSLNAISELRDRLRRTSAETVGVLVSMSGFTASAIADAELHRQRPVLLFDGEDLEQLAHRRRSLRSMLADKARDLTVHGRVVVGASPSPSGAARTRLGRSSLSATGPRLLDPAGDDLPWVSAHGGYEPFAFLPNMPDIDWVPAAGYGVTLNLDAHPMRQTEFIDMLEQLAADDWVSNQGGWTIRQATTNWHGIGARSLIRALREWNERYKKLDRIHHTEEVVYAGACDGGLLRIAVDVGADHGRPIWHASLALQLIGIPLDTHPITKLAHVLDVPDPVYFRPLGQRAATVDHPAAQRPITLEPLAYIVQPDDQGVVWTTGLVVRNPGLKGRDPTARPTWWPDALVETEALVCALRHHLPFMERAVDYQLFSVHRTWLSDTMVVRVVADWIDT